MTKRNIALLLAVIIVFSLIGYIVFGNSTTDSTLINQNNTERISVTQKSFYYNGKDLYASLYAIKHGIENNLLTSDELVLYAEKVLRDMEGLGDYYNFFDKTSYTKKGVTYGAVPDGNPIGGGQGYTDIYTSGDYLVTNDDEFMHAVKNAGNGEVIFIQGDAVIDISDLRITDDFFATLSRGVTIASDRGHNDSKGGTIHFSANHSVLLRLIGDNRITGLCLQAANCTMANGRASEDLLFGILAVGVKAEIDNCEISGFSNGAIYSKNSEISIHHNYIHDNSTVNGYGINIENGRASIESNLFSGNITNIRVNNFDEITIRNNIDVGTSRGIPIVISGNDEAVLSFTNNSFLGSGQPYKLENVKNENITNNYNIYDFTDNDTLSLLGIKGFIKSEEAKSITAVPDIIMNVFAGDKNIVFDYIMKIKETSDDKSLALEYAIKALSELAGFSDYYNYLNRLSMEKDGVIYGAYVEDGKSPIGGGVGMSELYATGDYIVNDLDSLLTALDKAKSGEVIFIKGNSIIDTTSLAKRNKALTLNEGVTLASDRGRIYDDGTVSSGAIILSTCHAPVMIDAYADTKIEGLTLSGSDTWKHLAHHARGTGATGYTQYYYSLPLTIGVAVRGDNFIMSNCEVSGFSNSGVQLFNVKDANIRNCFFHHNQRNGFGYGICHNKASTSVIEYNLFNFDRHSIAADGSAGSGYIARYNIQMGDAIYHVFDAHGGGDRGDGTNIACNYVYMYNNTILCDKIPYKKRGVPQLYSKFYRNIVLNPIEYYSTRLMEGENITFYDNIFGIADIKAPEYDYEGGERWSFSISVFNKKVRSSGVTTSVFYLDENGYITSAGAGLRYAYILVFAPNEDGKFRITEYGNNLDDGTIMNWDEKVYIPESGFVLAFTNDVLKMKSLYDYITEEYSVIYNTTASIHGGYIADVTGVLGSGEITVTVTAAKKVDND